MRQNATLLTHARANAQQQAILAALRNGNTRRAAADCAGVHRATFYRWLACDPAFATAVVRAEAQCEILMTAILCRAAASDWRAALAWLERRRPLDWGKTIRLRDIDDETLLRLLEELL